MSFRIEEVELRVIHLDRKKRFISGFGASTANDTIICKVMSGGVCGYGEYVGGFGELEYSYESLGTGLHVLEERLIPRLIGQTLSDAGCFAEAAAGLNGHEMARACLEMAVWDLEGKLTGQSLSHLLGGTRTEVRSGISFGITDEVGELLRQIEVAVAKGYHRVKVKIEPGWDLEVVEAIRKRFPSIALTVDGNGAYSVCDMPRLVSLDAFDLMYIEQPFPGNELLAHKQLQEQVRAPLCMDESIRGPYDALQAIELRCCGVVNIKPGRVGGHREAIDVHTICGRHDVPVWCGGMWETGIGRAHNIALASLEGFSLPGDITPTCDLYEQPSLVTPRFVLDRNGMIHVPSGPGIGVEVRSDVLQSVTVSKKNYKA